MKIEHRTFKLLAVLGLLLVGQAWAQPDAPSHTIREGSGGLTPVVLAFRTGTGNADLQATMTWRELR